MSYELNLSMVSWLEELLLILMQKRSVCLLNLTEQPKRLKQGTQVAICNAVESVLVERKIRSSCEEPIKSRQCSQEPKCQKSSQESSQNSEEPVSL